METVLSSTSQRVRIGGENPFCIIGERINPTGRKLFQQQLRRGDLARVEGKGAFTKEVDAALLAGEADLAVHCVKDIPADRPLPAGDPAPLARAMATSSAVLL